ncbi:MAG TPA: SDR family oxidoreductase [Actinotalea caeni]|uniref:SDR family NAD(P)-dependent oxidoreductase n=1 Tax=Actinotalea caeni TaxID=1348467 RepID=UPI0012E2F00D|nr:SDR family oxidoreductase [Actinotalea caeni]HLV54583.1 SDR family oxidoreductase [Actinotalea caeni]
MTRRIVITGGGSGLGRAVAHRLLAETPSFALVGRRLSALEETAAELRETNPDVEVTLHSADLADPVAVHNAAAEITLGGSVDVLVLNAGGNFGVGAGSDLGSVAEAWRADFEGNVLTTVLLAHALRPHLTRPGARVVAMSSVAGIRGSGSYGAAKAAINAWVWSEASALATEGVTVNAVAPGFVPDTDFWRPRIEADPGVWDSRVAQIPMGRPGTPEEVAEAVAYLASPQAGWTTGQILQVNGGTVLGRG